MVFVKLNWSQNYVIICISYSPLSSSVHLSSTNSPHSNPHTCLLSDNITSFPYTPPPLPHKKYSLPEKDKFSFVIDALSRPKMLQNFPDLSHNTLSTSSITPSCSEPSLLKEHDRQDAIQTKCVQHTTTHDDVFDKPTERRHTVSSGSRLSHYDNVTIMSNHYNLFTSRLGRLGCAAKKDTLGLSG